MPLLFSQSLLSLLFGFGLSMAAPNPAQGADEGGAIESGVLVTIERVAVHDMRLRDTLDVSIQSGPGGFGGAVLKLGTDSRIVQITEILPGEIIDSCDWEFFRAIELNTMTEPDGPESVWQITALSKMSPDTTKPACLGFDRPATIARLVVSSAHIDRVPDTTVAVFFYWESCRDNAVSDASGAKMQVSNRVIDYFPVDLAGDRDVFPTRLGTPKQCINPRLTNAPTRSVDFHNGGVEFKLEVGAAEPDSAQPADSSSVLH